ncbi:hypothetical protein LUZ60_003768 [Juncus effusus]|nr:hypothetical protein LUZ60_003768 [Juncus effusus]
MKMKHPSSNSFEFGCISTILHRLLFRNRISNEENCSDDINGELSKKETKSESPSIVARLMGLDSMPIVPSSSTSDSFTRSRSANSVESWPGFINKRNQVSPVQSSISFREKPTYLRKENEEFLLLSFSPDENEDGFVVNLEKMKRRRRKQRRENREKEKCRKLRRVKREEILEKCDENGELPLILNLEKFELEKSQVETECLSQNSSPVSVLDLPDTQFETYSPKSGVEQSTEKKQQSSRRKLSSNFEDITNFEPFSIDKQINKSIKPEMKFRDASKFCGHICKIVEKDLKESIWTEKEMRSSIYGEEISAEIGLEILDQLILEATYEFCCNFTIL